MENRSGIIGIILMALMGILVFEGCSIAPKSDAKKFYKLDIKIETKEVKASGMIVLPLKKSYTIKLRTPGKMDVLYLKTCGRDFQWERVRSGLNKKKAVIHYTPNEIEREGACPIKIESYDKKGRHAVGFIDFQSAETTLPGTVVCEPKAIKFSGVSKCQGAVGSIKRIKFDVDVITRYDELCFMNSPKLGKVFEFNMSRGYCTFTFVEVQPPHRRHRLETYGYEEFRPRKQ